jgi:acetoin utilization protein AcuB
MTEHVAQFMSASPHTIQGDHTLAVAKRWMQEHAIRHLPVMDRGVLIGVLSERDVHLVMAIPGVDPEKVSVKEAMTVEPYIIAPNASVAEVAATMATQRYGSAIVVDKGHVVGVFTTVDALRVLARVLSRT